MSVPFPGWDQMRNEAKEIEPGVMFLIRNENGDAVRWIEGSSKKGMNRVNWDLRFSPPNPINLSRPAFQPPWAGTPQGPLVEPGTYSAELYVLNNGSLQSQGTPQKFMVKPVIEMSANDLKTTASFNQKTRELSRRISGANRKLGEAGEKLRFMKAALKETAKASPDLFETLVALNNNLTDLRMQLTGDRVLRQMNESSTPSIMNRVGYAMSGWDTTQMPTETQKQSVEMAESMFNAFQTGFNDFLAKLSTYEIALESAGAPWTPGRDGK